MVYIPCIYIVLQMAVLVLLRSVFLMTVYQTVAIYGAICLTGLGLMILSDKSHRMEYGLAVFRDCYLILWSGVHGVIVLGLLTAGGYYLSVTQLTLVQVVNIFLGISVYWCLYFFLGRTEQAIGWGNLLIGLMGILNYYLVRFRGAPFQLSDIRAAKTAGNVFWNYDYTPGFLLIAALVDMLLWYVIFRQYLQCREWKKIFGKRKVMAGEKSGRAWMRIGGVRKQALHRNVFSVTVTFIIICGYMGLFAVRFQDIYSGTALFAQDTYLAKLLAEAMGNTRPLPEEYSVEDVQAVVTRFREERGELSENKEEDMASPNIIVIMNEAFADLRILGEFQTTVPVLSFWDSVYENCTRGWANVSVLGGTTANSEYEFLTSDAVGVYSGLIPYNRYFDSGESYPGLVSVLKEQGYETTAFHPYWSSGWNRPQVYRAMGFDRIAFLEDVDEEMDTLRLYVSDRADYSYIIKYFDEKEAGVPQFFFNVTMQNHGGYTYSGNDFKTTVQLSGAMQGKFPQTEQYLSCLKESDAALEELFSYFENYEEPVIVVLYGDHQPRLEDGFYEYVTGQDPATWSLEQRMNQYKTPFVIWHNYPVDSRDLGDVSVNYLAAIMLEQTGLKMSDYQKYTLSQFQNAPVITTLGVKDADGYVYPADSDQYRAFIEDYQMLIYNHTVDKEGRREDFFRMKE